MASPAAIHPRIAARSVRLLVNSGALLISAAGMVHTAAGHAPACALVGFIIFLLGVSLVTLALVAATQQQQQLAGSALPSKTANPAAVGAHMPTAAGLLRRASVVAFANRLRAARHVRLRPDLIAGTAALLVSTAGSFIIAAAVDGPPQALFLAAFVVFLLGVWLALLALFIMDRVPEAETGSVAIA